MIDTIFYLLIGFLSGSIITTLLVVEYVVRPMRRRFAQMLADTINLLDMVTQTMGRSDAFKTDEKGNIVSPIQRIPPGS